MSKDVPAEDVLIFLNLLFSRFDMLVERHGVQKIDTVRSTKSFVAAGMHHAVFVTTCCQQKTCS
jgi:hypothetical protein